MNDTIIRLASFDIGKKNFAFCVEEINLNDLLTIENIPKTSRYFKDGTCTPEFLEILKKVYTSGKIILLENVDLTENCNKKEYLDPLIFINMNKVLDKYQSYWDTCTSFIIEQQMGFGKKRNYMALKLGQHCFSYFIFNYANFKDTIDYPAYYKTKVLGAPKKISKYQRKMWAVNKAMDILSDRNDFDNIKSITSRKKRDDVADVIVQLQSYKFLVFVDKNVF